MTEFLMDASRRTEILLAALACFASRPRKGFTKEEIEQVQAEIESAAVFSSGYLRVKLKHYNLNSEAVVREDGSVVCLMTGQEPWDTIPALRQLVLEPEDFAVLYDGQDRSDYSAEQDRDSYAVTEDELEELACFENLPRLFAHPEFGLEKRLQ